MNGTCDACRATTSTTVRLRDGGQLDLCDGHARLHAPTLTSQGALLVGPLRPVALSPAGMVIERPPSDASPRDHAAGRYRRVWTWLGGRSPGHPSDAA